MTDQPPPRIELLDGAPDPGALDARLRGPCVAVITAPAPARAALTAACVERGVPCVVAVPPGPDARDWEPLLRSGGRAVALVPALAAPGVTRALDLAARGALGVVRSVVVRAPGHPDDEAALLAAACLALAALPGADAATLVGSRRAGDSVSLEIRGAGGERATATVGPEEPGAALEIEGTETRAQAWRHGGRDALVLRRGAATREVPLPDAPGPEARLCAAAAAGRVPAWLQPARVLHAWTLCAPVLPRREPAPPRPPGPGETAAWRAAVTAAREARNPHEALLAAGLVPDSPVPDGAREPPDDRAALVTEPLEAFAFDAGLKPALYLTVPRERADEVRARYAGLFIETVAYTLARDALSDTRRRVNADAPEGGTHVDLFVCRDADSARRAREIYRDPRGPSVHLAEMGALLGYPPCCVAAFASLPDRSNNSANRHACRARTAALGYAFEPEINNLFAHVVPFFPCTYACPRGVALARGVLDALSSARPDAAAALRASLARPALYADHARHVMLSGAARDGRSVVRYAGVLAAPADGIGGGPEDAPARLFRAGLAHVLSAGDGLRDAGGRWEVLRGDRVVGSLARREPALVELFPFGLRAT